MSFTRKNQICLVLWLNDSQNEGFRYNLRGKYEFTFYLDMTVREMVDDLKEKLGVDPDFKSIFLSKRMNCDDDNIPSSEKTKGLDWKQADRRSDYMNDNLPGSKREIHLMMHKQLYDYDLSNKEDIYVYFECELPDSIYTSGIREPIATPKDDNLGSEWNDLPSFCDAVTPPSMTRRVSFFDEDDYRRDHTIGPVCSSSRKYDYQECLLDDD